MKRHVNFLFASFAALTLFSCAREAIVPEEKPLEDMYSYTFDLSQDQSSKALLEDGGVIAWEEGDKMAVYINTGSEYELVPGIVSISNKEVEGAQAKVSFSCSTELTATTPVFSYYPYHEEETTATVTLPVAAEQDGTMSAMPMVGKLSPSISGTGELTGQFLMMNLGGAFQYRVYSSNHSGEKIEKITMTTTEQHLCASASYNFSTFETAWSETGSNAVSVQTRGWIDVPSAVDGAQAVQMIVAPGSYVNPKITVYTDKATYSKTLSSTYEIVRNYLKAFKVNLDNWDREARPQATITWSINKVESQTSQAVSTKLMFPEVSEIAGYEFMGWATEEISGTQQDAPEMINADSDVAAVDGNKYYAVYAKKNNDDITEELTNAEINSLSASGALAYDTEKTYTDGTIEYSIYAYTDQANRKWIQVKKDQGVYVRISAPSAIRKVLVTLTSPTNSSGGINDITKHTAYSGTVGLTASDCTYSSSSSSLAKTDVITDNIATLNLSGTEKDVYLKVSTGARIWSLSVSYVCDTPSYSDYCTFVETREATSLSWSAASYTIRTDETPSYPTLTTSPVNLAGVTYDSSNKDVATIDAAGAVTLVAPGLTTITASFAGNSTYQPATDASYELTVNEATQKHTLHFSINEDLDAGTLVSEGDPINFPEDPSIDGVLFLGWVKEALDVPQQTAPTCVVKAEEKMGTEDVTYYAVFYKRSGSAPSVELAQTLQYDTWSYSGSTTDKSSYRLFHSGSYIESAAFDRSKLTKVIVYGGTFGGDSYNKLTIGDGTNTWKSVTVSGSSQTGVNTYTNGTALSGTGKLRITSNSGSASSNGVRISKVEIYVQTGGYVYSDYCTTVITLRSIAISGSVSKTTYDAGDVLDPTGLTVTATYSDNSNADVTSLVEWSFSPATLPAGDNQSCTATATYGGKFASKEVTGLTVRETSKEDPTITATNKADLAVNASFDVSTMFRSNSTGAFTFEITDNPESKGSLAADGKTFKATAAGTYTIQASQAATPTYNAGVKTATITVVAGGEKNVVIDKTTTGSTSNSYVTTDTEFTTDGVTYKVKNWNPSTLQVRGNQSTAGNNFHIYNTTAMPSGIKTIVVTVDGSITTNKIFVATGTSAKTSHITSGTQGVYDSTAKTLTFTLNTSDKYFTLCLVNGSTSGTVKFTNIQITY